MTAVREEAPRTPPRFVVRTVLAAAPRGLPDHRGRLRPLPAGGRQQVRDAAPHDHRATVRPVAGRDHRLLRGRPEPRHPGHERLGREGARLVAEPPGAARHDGRAPRRNPCRPGPRRGRRGTRSAVGQRSATTPAGATTSTASPPGVRADGGRRPRAAARSPRPVLIAHPAARSLPDGDPTTRSMKPDSRDADQTDDLLSTGWSDARPRAPSTSGSSRGSPSRPLRQPPGGPAHGLGLGRSCCSGSSRTSRPCWASASRMPAGRWHLAPCRSSTRCITRYRRWCVLGLAVAGILSPFWLVGALAWFSHIVVDLAFGHGLRTADGWRRPWWTSR